MTSLGTRSFYSIQQVSEMTNLSKQVIRKWEERYKLVQPIRLANGYRRYDDRDINLILSALTLTEQGYSIKQAAEIVKQENIVIEKVVHNSDLRQTKDLDSYVLKLLVEGEQCDELEMNAILQQAHLEYGLARFLKIVVQPFMLEVGYLWGSGRWDEFQESVASLIVRDFLVQLRRSHQSSPDAPLILGACLPYERHEIPLHIILLQFMMKGWRTILIGASPAAGSIEALVTKLKPEKVLLSAVTEMPFKKNPQLLDELDSFAMENNEIQFYLGGPGGVEFASGKKLAAIHVTDTIEKII